MSKMDRDIAIAALIVAVTFVAMLVLAASEAIPECNAATVAHQVLPK